MTDNLDLEALTALCDAATPGPWRIFEHVADGGRTREFAVEEPRGYYVAADVRRGSNAQFIAAARTAVPELVAEVKRLTRWKLEAMEVIDGLQELGQALGLDIGERITGPVAVQTVTALTADRDSLSAQLEEARARIAELERENEGLAAADEWAPDPPVVDGMPVVLPNYEWRWKKSEEHKVYLRERLKEATAQRDEARTKLAAQETALREQIAAEIEAAGRAEVQWLSEDTSTPLLMGRLIGTEDGYKAAARIARGEDR